MRKLLVAALAASFFSPLAFAQTCAAPAGPANGSNVPLMVQGTTCGADATSFGTSYCQGGIVAPGAPAAVVAIDVGPVNHLAITVATTTTTFNPALFLIGPNSCGSTTACIDENDANPAGGSERLPSSGVEIPQQPAGRYYLAITSMVSATDCGTFSATFDGFPVELQSFSID